MQVQKYLPFLNLFILFVLVIVIAVMNSKKTESFGGVPSGCQQLRDDLIESNQLGLQTINDRITANTNNITANTNNITTNTTLSIRNRDRITVNKENHDALTTKVNNNIAADINVRNIMKKVIEYANTSNIAGQMFNMRLYDEYWGYANSKA